MESGTLRTPLSHALIYAERGWSVFPVHYPVEGRCSCGNPDCGSPAKHPMTEHGYKDATTDPTRIRNWWVRWPKANVAIVTGAASQLIVLDVDGDEGRESVKDFKTPETPVATTGKGTHFYFHHPGGEVRNFARKLPGVDLRGDGGYVVAPPSNHITGRVYEWATSPGVSPAEPPEWLMDLLRGPKHEHTPPPPDEQKKKLLGKLRPCFYAMTQGEGPAIHDGGIVHDARIALVAEAQYHRATIPMITSLFQGCSDFNPETTERAVKGLTHRNLTEGIQGWGCETIRERGWCPLESVEDCGFYRIFVKESTAEPPDLFFVTNPETGRKVFNPKKMSDYVQESHHFLATSQNSDLWIYHPETGIWKPDGSEKLHKICEDLLQHRWRRAHVAEVETHVRHGNYVPITDLGGPINKLVVKNGVLDLETRQLQPFTHDLYATTAIPVAYNPDADCPRTKKFFSEVVPEKKVPVLEEITGYCLHRSYPIAVITILTGTGANGKTVFLRLLAAFLGVDNYSSVDIQNLTEESFRAAELYSKLANISGDLPSKPIKDSGLIKKATGQDPITAAKKYRDPFQFFNYGKLIFSANEVPDTYDDSDAFYRRINLAEFPNKFEPDDPKTDPNLIEKLTTPEELSGLLNLALDGLDRLLSKGMFTGQQTTEDRKMDYMSRSNTAKYFMMKYVEQTLDPEYCITKGDLYEHYVYMCHGMGATPKSDNWFSRLMKRIVPYASEGYEGKTKIWHGIKVNQAKLEADFPANAAHIKQPETPKKRVKQANISDATAPTAPTAPISGTLRYISNNSEEENKKSIVKYRESKENTGGAGGTGGEQRGENGGGGGGEEAETPHASNVQDLYEKAEKALGEAGGWMWAGEFWDALERLGHPRRLAEYPLNDPGSPVEFVGFKVRLKEAEA